MVIVKNVTHFCKNPATGQIVSKKLKDGTYEEVQAQIEEFEAEIKENKDVVNTEI